jgi:hypothetical protein
MGTSSDGQTFSIARTIRAIEKAERTANGKAAELWEGARIIVRLPSDEG